MYLWPSVKRPRKAVWVFFPVMPTSCHNFVQLSSQWLHSTGFSGWSLTFILHGEGQKAEKYLYTKINVWLHRETEFEWIANQQWRQYKLNVEQYNNGPSFIVWYLGFCVAQTLPLLSLLSHINKSDYKKWFNHFTAVTLSVITSASNSGFIKETAGELWQAVVLSRKTCWQALIVCLWLPRGIKHPHQACRDSCILIGYIGICVSCVHMSEQSTYFKVF